MDFFRRASGAPARLGVLAGTFNPVTVAHVALARAALAVVDEVLFVLPREFPHKPYAGASFGQRIELLEAALAEENAFSLASSDGGLFVDIAADCRQAYGAGAQLFFLCGRDAAERVAGWNYGLPDAFAEMLRGFGLLVAARGGGYQPPSPIQAAVRHLELAPEFDCISATEVRLRIARGAPWEHMVPAAIAERVGRIYGRGRR